MNDNPTRHVLVALSLSALVMLVAGSRWTSGIAALHPVRVVPAK